MRAAVVLVFILIFACQQSDNRVLTNFDGLSKYYVDTVFTDLLVFPDLTYNDSLYSFKGTMLDSLTVSLLESNVTRRLPWTEGFYGNYSFKIDDQYTGLVTRTPGAYSSTRISLWIFDVSNDSITNSVEIADIFGDAGYHYVISSYLFFDEVNRLNALSYAHDLYDRSLEDETDTAIEQNYHYYLTRINYSSVDTLSTDSLKLSEQFRKQLNIMASY